MLPSVEVALTTIAAIPIWGIVSILISHIGGWWALSKRYPADGNCECKTFRMRSGRIGLANYGMCLVLTICESGLRMSVLFPFRIGHPPIFIPWNEFHRVMESRILIWRNLEADIGTPVVAHIVLPIWLRDYIPS